MNLTSQSTSCQSATSLMSLLGLHRVATVSVSAQGQTKCLLPVLLKRESKAEPSSTGWSVLLVWKSAGCNKADALILFSKVYHQPQEAIMKWTHIVCACCAAVSVLHLHSCALRCWL